MSRDEEVGRIKLRVSSEMWTAIHSPGLDPPTEIGRRGADFLRTEYQCEEDEVRMICEDSLYQNSCRTQYWEAKRLFDRKQKLPRKFVLEFNRPGTRDARMREKPEEAEP